MKKVRFFLFLIAGIFVADRLCSIIMDEIYQGVEIGQSGGKINYLINEYDHISMLAIGNSRCAHHVIPEIMGPDSYNLSHNGMSLIFHTGLIDQLLTNEKLKVDTILLHLEFHELFDQSRGQHPDIQHLKYYYGKNDWIQQRINALSSYEAVKFAFKSFRYNGKVVSLLANRVKSLKVKAPIDGYTPSPPHERDSINVTWQLQNVDQSTYIPYNEIMNQRAKDYLLHVQSLCEKENTKLICFTSPIYGNPEITASQKGALTSFFNKNQITYIDFSSQEGMNSNLTSIWDWKDLMHLNESGAVKFSKVLREVLNAL